MSVFKAEDSTKSSPDRVRKSTAVQVNTAIDHQTDLNIHLYKDKSQAETLEHIQALDKEWGIERLLEVNASFARDRFAISFAAWLTRLVPSFTYIASAGCSYPRRNRS